jgi:glycosyltransferase involved in cell wall biosynthesis
MKPLALVYDWLIEMGGGEKTLAAIAEVFPAPIYTLIAKQLPSCLSKKTIHSSFLQNLPFVKHYYRSLLPFFPNAIERLDVSNYERILSVSHAVAKGVVKKPGQLHICYCFTPMRYAWDLSNQYLESLGGGRRFFAKKILKRMRRWDIASLERVDHFIAISRYISERIKRLYQRECAVIYPPVDTERIPLETNKEDIYVTVSRMVPYKKIDLLVEAFSQRPDKKLIVIGDGPERRRIESKAARNVQILGYQNDAVVQQALCKARGFVFAAEEDFGIVPVEAQAAGTPVIAFGKGGALETVINEKTGLFFSEQTTASLLDALDRFEKRTWDPATIRAHACRFSKARFQKEFKERIEAFG